MIKRQQAEICCLFLINETMFRIKETEQLLPPERTNDQEDPLFLKRSKNVEEKSSEVCPGAV
jgi:hypothetical protein